MVVKDLLSKLKNRSKISYKGDYGHVFVLAGSLGLTGAAALTSEAALRAGSGLVTLGIPESLNNIMEVKLTEVMTLPLPETAVNTFSLAAFPIIEEFIEKKVNVMAIGPGIGKYKETFDLVRKIVKQIHKDMVIDADGINAFEEYNDTSIFREHKGRLIITPHVGEMAKLIKESNEFVIAHREKIAVEFANKYNIVVVLKGHNTIVASPLKEIYINKTGNPGMATAGSGDVLTGMIASFLGQGFNSFEAAVLGVYAHGAIGDKLKKKKGEISLIASDIIEEMNLNIL